ncbi:MAG: hypothetical protein ACO1QB_07270 [Verrucomicrobiales bacterium]
MIACIPHQKNFCPKPVAVTAMILFSAFGGAVSLHAQDHGHLNIGAVSHAQGSQLIFENGPDFAPASGYVKTLVFTSTGKYAGKYNGNITLTALHSIDAFGDPVPNSPAPGSFIVAEIVSVDGPQGGAFEFWDATSTTEPTYSLPVGISDAQKFFEVSDAAIGAGQPGADPFGHIHGRRFTVTKPGIYTVGFRAHDQSTNGSEEGSIHQSSEVATVRFQGGHNLLNVMVADGQAHVSYVATAGFTWQLEFKNSIEETAWTLVGEPRIGSDIVLTEVDARPMDQSRIYRLKGLPIEL